MRSRKVLATIFPCVALLVFASCRTNVRFYKTDLTPIVKVDTSDSRWKLHCKIINPTEDHWPANTLAVKMRADYATEKENNCVVEHTYNVYEDLPPDGTFEFKPITFDDPPLENVSSDCDRCLKDKCGGVLFITLIKLSNNQRIEGTKTKYLFQWSKNDGVAQVTEVKN